MFQITKKQIDWAGRPLTLETGRIARQADGAVVATYGETVVLCTVVAQKTPKEGIDFMPLTVIYQEKAFAAGRIPGGFFKREGRPSEKEILTSRLIDRPIRPLFPDNFHNETQVICTLLSHDITNDPDIVAMVGAAAALAISGIPFHGPIAGVRVGFMDGSYVANPSLDIMDKCELDLVVAGTKDSVLMVESEAKQLSEEVMLGAVKYGLEQYQCVIEMIEQFAAAAGAAAKQWPAPQPDEQAATLKKEVADFIEAELRTVYKFTGKQERSTALDVAKKKLVKHFVTEKAYESIKVLSQFSDLQMHIVRRQILETKLRIDGRDEKTIRPILAEVGVLPRTHGSALFTRGETQALVVATLGTTQDEQIIDALDKPDTRQHFMLHYNFPPYSVGEATPMRAPGRREIGHGKLAWRAINAMLPDKADFPYTLRVVSEITESNGSSSMATVCGTSLAMMDAGIPIKSPVAGIAMGLIKEPDGFAVLSDILGDEDYLGDMDFKVAGTKEGVTALQMDIKIRGITIEIMEIALAQAKEGRHHILGEMAKALTKSRAGLSANAPTITTLHIHKDKIREVIGSGGKVIRDICEKSGAKIDIEDDGTIRIAATTSKSRDIAQAMIVSIVAEPEVGVIYTGKVVKIAEFGAFVNFLGARDGLVHISELKDTRVNNVSDVISEGDEVKVKLIGVDNRGKLRLSMRVVDQVTGEEIAGKDNA